MSADVLSIIALLASAVLIGARLASGRRKERLEREARQLEQWRATREPPQPEDALARVVDELSTAQRLLEEVSSIGLWSKSDDSGDNRQKRQGLREIDWAVSGALRALTDLRAVRADLPAALHDLEQELRILVAQLEPLPDTISDTMGENHLLDSTIIDVAAKLSELRSVAAQLTPPQRETER